MGNNCLTIIKWALNSFSELLFCKKYNFQRWLIYKYRVCIGNVFKHMINGPFGSIALSIIAPTTSSCRSGQGSTVGKTTAKRLVANRIRAFLVIRIVMSVRYMKNLESRCFFLGRYRRLNRRFANRWKCNFPLVQWIVSVVAGITDHETANLRWFHVHLFQNVNNLALKILKTRIFLFLHLPHSRRLFFFQ